MLGEDQHGLWLGGRVGTENQKGTDAPIGHSREPWVFCSPPKAWWSLAYNGDNRKFTHFVDIITPPVIRGDTIEMIDLDLDVVRRLDGTTFVDDEDEFAEHQIQLGYPDWMIDKARTTTAERFIAMSNLEEPFDQVCRDWYDKLAELTA